LIADGTQQPKLLHQAGVLIADAAGCGEADTVPGVTAIGDPQFVGVLEPREGRLNVRGKGEDRTGERFDRAVKPDGLRLRYAIASTIGAVASDPTSSTVAAGVFPRAVANASEKRCEARCDDNFFLSSSLNECWR
jgi:hypothetical protein